MERLRGVGHAVGEYVGDGQGDADDTAQPHSSDDADPDVDEGLDEQDKGDSSEDAYPLLFFYDCETTGFSIYNEHITELAGKVVAVGAPSSAISQPSFTSLVHTARHISKPG